MKSLNNFVTVVLFILFFVGSYFGIAAFHAGQVTGLTLAAGVYTMLAVIIGFIILTEKR
jgi:hypothetical protein